MAGARDNRRALLARLHIAQKEMGLDPTAYGEVLLRVAGVESAKTLTDAQLNRVLVEFKRLGWVPRAFKPASPRPNVRMIFGLWKDLAPFLADPSQKALRAFVQRQTKTAAVPDGVAAPEFLNGTQANRVIEGLKSWLARERAGVRRAPVPAMDAPAEGESA